MTAFAAVCLPSAATASAAARRYVRNCLRRLGRDELIPAAERGIATLTAAANLGAAAAVTVQVFADPTDGTVRITVTDDNPLLPLAWMATLRATATARAHQLLDVVGRCGIDVDRRGSGKTVWFEPGPLSLPGAR